MIQEVTSSVILTQISLELVHSVLQNIRLCSKLQYGHKPTRTVGIDMHEPLSLVLGFKGTLT